MTKHETILEFLRTFDRLIGGDNIYKSQLESAKCVEVSKCTDVLTKEQICQIKRIVKPKMHLCYKNSYKTADLLQSIGVDCTYCEGYLFDKIPIEHAFNKIGDKYIDVTAEFALKQDPTQIAYATIGEYSFRERMNASFESGCYGGVFSYYFNKKQR